MALGQREEVPRTEANSCWYQIEFLADSCATYPLKVFACHAELLLVGPTRNLGGIWWWWGSYRIVSILKVLISAVTALFILDSLVLPRKLGYLPMFPSELRLRALTRLQQLRRSILQANPTNVTFRWSMPFCIWYP